MNDFDTLRAIFRRLAADQDADPVAYEQVIRRLELRISQTERDHAALSEAFDRLVTRIDSATNRLYVRINELERKQ